MSDSLYSELCNTNVECYQKMKARGDFNEDIATCVSFQLKELNPECIRYHDVFYWTKKNIDPATFRTYGFGCSDILPVPKGMCTKKILDCLLAETDPFPMESRMISMLEKEDSDDFIDTK